MSLRISFELSDSDLRFFRNALRRSRDVVRSADESEIIDSQTVPYARFRRGQSRWVTLKFDEPMEVPEKFWVIFDFGAERTKGVYVSYDTATGGQHSRIGLPGAESEKVDFGGDWMVQLMLTKPE